MLTWETVSMYDLLMTNQNDVTNATTACVCSTPYEMTIGEFAKKHRDFKGIDRDANNKIVRRSALRFCSTHGTTSCTVTIVKVKS